MQLRASQERPFKNLEVIRDALAQWAGKEVIELSNGNGAAKLSWAPEGGGARSILRMAIPLAWMDDPTRIEELKAITRSLAAGVRCASSEAEKKRLSVRA